MVSGSLFQRIDVFVAKDHFSEFPEKAALQRLGKNFCKHLLGRTMLDVNGLKANSVLDKELADVDMS
jgi:hypothetical protein